MIIGDIVRLLGKLMSSGHQRCNKTAVRNLALTATTVFAVNGYLRLNISSLQLTEKKNKTFI